jgi:acetyl-CoA synthetase
MAEAGVADIEALHRWSVEHRDRFWQAVIRRLGIVFDTEPETVLDVESGVEDPDWLPGARLSIVESCFTAPADAVAVVSGPEGTDQLVRTTYGELRQLVLRAATGLERLGFGAGSRIALYMPMNLECVVAYLAVVSLGAAVVSVADSFPAPELAKRLEIAEADGIITEAAFRRGAKIIDLWAKVTAAGAPRAVVIPGAAEQLALRDGDVLWDDVVTSPPNRHPLPGAPDTITNVLFSSGTTGTPKAIPWTQLTPIKCAMDGHLHHDIRPDDVVAWPTNIGWMMGPWLIYAALVNRATIALYEGLPSASAFLRFVDQARITMLGVVPSLVRAWRSTVGADELDWQHVRVLSSTGEPSNPEDYLWLMSRTRYRAPVIEYCGGTEIGGAYITGSVLHPASPATFTTPAFGLDLVLLGEDGQPAHDGEMGEVFLVPPSIGLSQRLLNRDHHEVYHAGCPQGPAGEILRRHGDQLVRLPGGFYQALGRADDTMNLGGIKTSSREIEAVADAHPHVAESAAIGVRAGDAGAEQLTLVVVPRGRVDGETLRAELAARIAAELNPLFKLHDLVLIDRLPRTATNKLMRRTLRDRFAERSP